MKVLHGMTEIAGQGSYSVKGLRQTGVDATLAVWGKNPRGYGGEYEVGIVGSMKKPGNILKVLKFAAKAMRDYDCYHFHFAKSLIPGNWDLLILKLLKKKVFFEFHGSEIRNVINNIPYKYMNVFPEALNKKQIKRLKRIAKYATAFIIHDEELRPHLPKSQIPVHIVPLRLDIGKFKPKYPEDYENNPLIVHAPSNRDIKNTAIIEAVLLQIHMDYRWQLVENMTQEEAFKVYKKADIVFDQISGGSYGVFAIEAMALGKPVLCYISEEMKKSFPQDLPIISVTPDNLKYELEKLINDSSLRKAAGQKGREYAEKYHDYVKNGQMLKDIYEGKR